MDYKRSIKMISIVIIVTYLVTNVLPWQQFSMAADNYNTERTSSNSQSTSKNIAYEQPSTKTDLGNFTQKLAVYIQKLDHSIENNALDQFQTDLKATKGLLKDLKKDIAEELQENEEKLEDLNADAAMKRHNRVSSNIQTQLEAFETLLEELLTLSGTVEKMDTDSRKALKAKLNVIKKKFSPEQPEQTLGSSLPTDKVSGEPIAPSTGNGINASYMSNNSEEASDASLPQTPVEEDLAETVETQQTKEIKALADKLATPLKMYEYVRNQVDYEAYYGSRKGAAGTLSEMAGNDYDQASLLMAMLRYKKIPARYVKGTIEVSIDRAMEWTATTTPKAAVKSLCSLGIPITSIVSAGTISAVQVEHIWVEAYVPYSIYNRTGMGKGNKIWIPLDPSFKQYTLKEGLDITKIANVSEDEIFEAYEVNGDYSDDGNALTNVDTESLHTFLGDIYNKTQQYIKDNNLENADTKEIIGGKSILSEKLGMLPLTLPYETITVLSEDNTIPKTDVEKVGFSIRGNDPYNLNFSGANDFNANFTAAKLYGKRITLSWIPATQEDKDIIQSYGGLDKTPAYMIQLKPQVKVDGEVAAEGKAAGYGNRQEFSINMGHAGEETEAVTNVVTVGGLYSIALDYGNISVNELETLKEKVLTLKDKATEENIYTDEVMGAILHSAGKAYFAQLDGMNTAIAGAYKVNPVRQLSEGMVGYQPAVKYMFNIPVEVTGGKFFIDVDHNVFSVNSREDQQENETAFMMESGVVSSAMEHVIMEQIFQVPSVSTIKILSEANDRRIPIYSIGKDNMDKVDELSVSSTVKTDIINAVGSGKIVIIPQKEMNYYNWHGTGYIVMDPQTGAAGYMISGGLAGGAAAVDVEVVLAGLVTMAWAVVDTMTAATAMVGAANPILGVFFGVMTLMSAISVLYTIKNISYYMVTGDYKYAKELLTDLAMNIVSSCVFKFLELFAPFVGKFLKNIPRYFNGYSKFATKYGDDVAEAIARMNGESAIIHADELIVGLRESGVTNDVAVNIARKGGVSSLEEVSRLIDEYPEAAEILSKHGDNLDEVIECITKYKGSAVKALKNGIEPGIITKLDNMGIKPDDFERKGITNAEKAAKAVKEAVDGVAEAVSEIEDDIDNNIDELFVDVEKISKNGDLYEFETFDEKKFQLSKSEIDASKIDELDDIATKMAKETFNKNPADPFRDVLGAGLESNPEEWNNIISEVEKAGGKVRYSENGTMAYSPLSKGVPGEIVIDKNASLCALKHEYKHFIDDMADGWSGMEALYDFKKRSIRELRAYMVEIKEADRLGLKDIANQLWDNYLAERKYIIDNFGPLPQ